MSEPHSANKIYNRLEVAQYLENRLNTWHWEECCICRRYKTTGWKSTLFVVNAIAYLAEAGWHHPDLEVSYDSVTVRFTNHDAGGVTRKDFEMAEKVEQILTWEPGEDRISALGTNPNKILNNN